MKIFRVPKKGGYWNHTDTKEGVVKYFENEIYQKQEESDRLTEAFLKLYRLTSLHKDKAPDDKALIESVHTIADFYYMSIDNSGEDNPEIEWIDWNSI